MVSAQEVINKFAHGERNFAGLSLKGANFSNLSLKGIILIGCDLEGSNFDGTDLTAADLRNSRLNRAVLTSAVLKGTNFEGADLSGANIRDAYIENTIFRKAVLMWAHLCANDLRKADLTDAHLDWSCLIGTQLTDEQKSTVPEKAILAGEEKASKEKGAAGYVGKGTGASGYATSATTEAKGYKEDDVSIIRGYKGGEEGKEVKYKHESSIFEEHGAPQKKEERIKRELKRDLRGK